MGGAGRKTASRSRRLNSHEIFDFSRGEIVVTAVTLDRPFEPAAVAAAAELVRQRHPRLRAVVRLGAADFEVFDDEAIVQVREHACAVDEAIAREAAERPDPSVCGWRLATCEANLILTYDHVLLDGTSVMVMLQEVIWVLDGAALPSPDVPPVDLHPLHRVSGRSAEVVPLTEPPPFVGHWVPCFTTCWSAQAGARDPRTTHRWDEKGEGTWAHAQFSGTSKIAGKLHGPSGYCFVVVLSIGTTDIVGVLTMLSDRSYVFQTGCCGENLDFFRLAGDGNDAGSQDAAEQPLAVPFSGKWVPAHEDRWGIAYGGVLRRSVHRWEGARLVATSVLGERVAEVVGRCPEDPAVFLVRSVANDGFGTVKLLPDGTYEYQLDAMQGKAEYYKAAQAAAGNRVQGALGDVVGWVAQNVYSLGRYLAPKPTAPGAQHFMCRQLSLDATAKLRKRCSAEGCTVTAALSVAVARAVQAVLGWPPRVSAVISTRPSCGVGARTVGCFTAWRVLPVETHLAFWDAARRYKATLRQSIDLGLPLRCLDFVPEAVVTKRWMRGFEWACRESARTTRCGIVTVSNRGAWSFSSGDRRRAIRCRWFHNSHTGDDGIRANAVTLDGIFYLTVVNANPWCSNRMREDFVESIMRDLHDFM